jgi:hypothetical protein
MVMRFAVAEKTSRQEPQRTIPSAMASCLSLTLKEVSQRGHWVRMDCIVAQESEKFSTVVL